MKRLIICLCVGLLLSVLLPVTALAATDVSDNYELFLSWLAEVEAQRPSGYPYQAVFCQPSRVLASMTVFYSKSAHITLGSDTVVFYRTSGQNGFSNFTSNFKALKTTAITTSANGAGILIWQTTAGVNSGIPLGYYVENYSNATVAGLDSVSTEFLINMVEALSEPVVTVELEEVLEEAEAIEDIGYTVSSWGNLRSSITYGHQVLADDSKTQPLVDGATTRVRTSISGLTVTTTPAPLPGRDISQIGTGEVDAWLTGYEPILLDGLTVLFKPLIYILAAIASIKIVRLIIRKILG